jgi:hypothetical protein
MAPSSEKVAKYLCAMKCRKQQRLGERLVHVFPLLAIACQHILSAFPEHSENNARKNGVKSVGESNSNEVAADEIDWNFLPCSSRPDADPLNRRVTAVLPALSSFVSLLFHALPFDFSKVIVISPSTFPRLPATSFVSFRLPSPTSPASSHRTQCEKAREIYIQNVFVFQLSMAN